MSLRTRLRRLRGDRRGSMVPVVALGMTALCGFAGLGIDLGMVYLEKRRVQSVADLAALAAARTSNGTEAARRTLSDNGYRLPDALTVTPGIYAADRSVPIAGRFTPSAGASNATRVHLTSSVRTGVTRVVGGPASYAVSGEATAMRADLAAFGLGSRLLSLDAGIANALLSRLLGASVALSLMDYRALASLRVDALALLRGAAPRLGLQAGTYGDVLRGSLSAMDLTILMGQAADRTRGNAAALASLNALAASLSGTATSVRLAGLLTAGAMGVSPVSQGGEALWVNALDLIAGAAFLANSVNQVALDLGASVPGLARAKVTLRTGEAWRTSGFVGPGSGLSTAQQRILVEIWLPVPVVSLSLYLPIYLELAPARAVLRRIVCPWSEASERTVTLDVATGVSVLAIGTVPSSALDLGATRPPFPPATVLQAPLLTVTAAAASQLGASTQTLTFSDDDIRAGRSKTVSTNGLLASPMAGLLANLDLQVSGVALPGVLDPKGLIATVLGAAAAPIDALLVSILDLAGVRLGSADVAVTGTHCGGAVLVQ